jgi:flagellar basal-body rod modification protein FlgD
MEITQTQMRTGGSGMAERKDSANALSSDFETFLKMLTVQMQNQDPLNPIESTDFAVQLATFSGVEQQVRTNDLLERLASSMGGSVMSQVAQWIGREAQGTGAAFFDGSPVTVTIPSVAGADSVDLLVRDESGRTVDRLPADATGGDLDWSGIAATGQTFLEGLYTFTVEARAGDTIVGESPAEIRGIVREARVGVDGTVELVLDGGGVMSANDVSALRLADR